MLRRSGSGNYCWRCWGRTWIPRMRNKSKMVRVTSAPTAEHCGMATSIGLCLCVNLCAVYLLVGRTLLLN
ncbi:hypothetical protein MKW92_046790 [Papaver armeniacum]|nr:hypothetical protein MKW92_046790 [Papaver armeniacum]